MKPEIIITKIEEYINSLPKESREAYDTVMNIKAKYPQESIKTFVKNNPDKILNLLLIVDELKQELKEAEIKQSKGSSELERIKAINAYLSKNGREEFKKAWIENDKMCLTNGYTGFMFNKTLECVEISEQSIFNLSKCFPNESNYKETTLDIADVKYQIKLHKAKESEKKQKEKTEYTYIINNQYYNAKYLVDSYKILGGDIIFKQGENNLSPAILESENGKAIVMPIRKPKDR